MRSHARNPSRSRTTVREALAEEGAGGCRRCPAAHRRLPHRPARSHVLTAGGVTFRVAPPLTSDHNDLLFET